MPRLFIEKGGLFDGVARYRLQATSAVQCRDKNSWRSFPSSPLPLFPSSLTEKPAFFVIPSTRRTYVCLSLFFSIPFSLFLSASILQISTWPSNYKLYLYFGLTIKSHRRTSHYYMLHDSLMMPKHENLPNVLIIEFNHSPL